MRSSGRVSWRSSTASRLRGRRAGWERRRGDRAGNRFEPDVVVMDARLPDGTGIEACREIRAEPPETRVDSSPAIRRGGSAAAIIAGASGYRAETGPRPRPRFRDPGGARASRPSTRPSPSAYCNASRAAATGGASDELADLTAQERKILLLVAEGKTNKEVAAEVFLSDKTVKNYVSSILSKLNLQRRTQAAAFVAKHHLGQPPAGT